MKNPRTFRTVFAMLVLLSPQAMAQMLSDTAVLFPKQEFLSPAERAAQRSRWGGPWLAHIDRALTNAPASRSSAEQDCMTVAQMVMGCRLAPAAPDGAAVDVACVARQIDNRAWPEDVGKTRGNTYLAAFTYQCFGWIDSNQVPPMRR